MYNQVWCAWTGCHSLSEGQLAESTSGLDARVLPRKCTGHSKYPLPTTQEKTTHHQRRLSVSKEDSGHHQMVNTRIRLIIFFAAKDGEALYSQQKQDQELTVAQIMSSLLPNSDLN